MTLKMEMEIGKREMKMVYKYMTLKMEMELESGNWHGGNWKVESGNCHGTCQPA